MSETELNTADLRQALIDHFDELRNGPMMESARPGVMRHQLGKLEQQLAQALDKLDQATAMMESATRAEDVRRVAMEKFIKQIPVFVTPQQRDALLNMDTSDSMNIVVGLFESVLATSLPVKADVALQQGTSRVPTAGSKTSIWGHAMPGGKPPRFN